jgi:PAS domain S-box-containing protein
VYMADGGCRWHLSRGIPAQNEQGQLIKWYGTATDIHDFKTVQETLRKSEQRMRRLFDSKLFGFVIRDATGRVLEANDAYLKIIGYTRSEVETGRVNVRDITPPEYHGLDQGCSNEVVNQGFCKPYEKEYLRKDGTRVPVLIGYSLLEGEQPEYIGFVLDLSELKQAQEELLTFTQKLKRSNEELENFAFIASHDLREPLRKVYLFGNSLRRELEGQLSEEAGDYLNRMQNAAERMQAMINGLLDLSRVNKQGGEFEPVNMTRIALDVVEDLEAQITKTGGQVVIDDLPPVQGDPLQLRLLLQNLIGNALKYHIPETPPVVKVHARQIPGWVEIMVEDNGIGFDQKEVEKIFQPFQRLVGRNHYEGTGIGLAICKKIVERHGGEITAISEPGKGSTFIVTLPVTC